MGEKIDYRYIVSAQYSPISRDTFLPALPSTAQPGGLQWKHATW